MDAAEALARLTAMTSPSEDPFLTGDELQLLLDGALVADVNGLPPSSTAYTDTWDLRGAAAEGWRWKAGKVAHRVDFGTDVHRQSRDQLQKHCLAMAELYARGRIATMELSAGLLYDPVIGNLNGGT